MSVCPDSRTASSPSNTSGGTSIGILNFFGTSLEGIAVVMHSERGASRPVQASVAKTFVVVRSRRGTSLTEAGADRQLWWVTSALESFEGKELREAYYAGL